MNDELKLMFSNTEESMLVTCIFIALPSYYVSAKYLNGNWKQSIRPIKKFHRLYRCRSFVTRNLITNASLITFSYDKFELLGINFTYEMNFRHVDVKFTSDVRLFSSQLLFDERKFSHVFENRFTCGLSVLGLFAFEKNFKMTCVYTSM